MRRFIPLGFLLIAACVHRPPPLSFGPEGPLTDPNVVLRRVDANEHAVKGLKGQARLTIESPQGRGTLSLLAAVTEDGKLHLELLDFFGRPVSILVSDGQRLGIFASQEGRYYQGEATAENLSRFLPLALPPRALARLLLGRAPRLEDAIVVGMRLDSAARAYQVTLQRGDARQTLWVDTRRLRVIRSVEASSADPSGAVQLTLEGYPADPELPSQLPREMTLKDPGRKTTLVLRYGDDVALSVPGDPGLFDPKAPPSVPVQDM